MATTEDLEAITRLLEEDAASAKALHETLLARGAELAAALVELEPPPTDPPIDPPPPEPVDPPPPPIDPPPTPIDPPPAPIEPPPPPVPDKPKPRAWIGKKGEQSGLNRNSGVMAIGGPGLINFKNKLGYAPEFCMSSVFFHKGCADNMDALTGGPESDGDESVSWPSQINLSKNPQTLDWLTHRNGLTRDTWLGPSFMPVPKLCSWQVAKDISKGRYRNRFLQAGRRLRWQLDQANHRLDRFCSRGPVEPDQDTGCAVASVDAKGMPNSGIFQACYNNGMTYEEAINFWHDVMGQSYGVMREGSGFWWPYMWSPAHQSTHVPRAYNGGVMEYHRMLAEVDGACCSFHQSDDRIKTAELARAMVYSRTSGRNTLQIAYDACVAQNKPLMCLEWCPRYEGPPAPWVMPSSNLKFLAASQTHFFDFLDAHPERVFATAMLSSKTIDPDYLENLTYPNPYPNDPSKAGKLVYEPTHPNVGYWRDFVGVVINRMKRRTPPATSTT